MINYDFLATNLSSLLGEEVDTLTSGAIREAFYEKDREAVGNVLIAISKDIRARASTLTFPEGHETGSDRPSRDLGMATRYLNEIAQAVLNQPRDPSMPVPKYDDLGWHAFGAAIQAVAGLLAYIEQREG